MKIYLAGASRDPSIPLNLRDQLKARGFRPLASWLDIDQAHPPAAEAIWTTCMNEILIANLMIVSIPVHEPLGGAIFEAGFATALRMPKIIFNPYDKPVKDWIHAGRTYLSSDYENLYKCLEELK